MHPGVLRASSGLNLARGPLAVLSQANLFVCFFFDVLWCEFASTPRDSSP